VCRQETTEELQSLPWAETKQPLELLASSQQVRELAGVRAGRCLRGRAKEGRVVRQLSELPGPSAYGTVVLGCFALKNYQRTRPSRPPRRGRAPSRWFAKQNSFGCEGEGDLSKAACGWSSALGVGKAEPLQERLPRDVQACVCQHAGSAALACVRVPAKRVVTTARGLRSRVLPRRAGRALLVPAAWLPHPHRHGHEVASQRSVLSGLGSG